MRADGLCRVVADAEQNGRRRRAREAREGRCVAAGVRTGTRAGGAVKRRQRATSWLLRRMWGETGAIALQIEPQAPLTGVCADFESADLV